MIGKTLALAVALGLAAAAAQAQPTAPARNDDATVRDTVPPPANSRFGRVHNPAREAVRINPASQGKAWLAKK